MTDPLDPRRSALLLIGLPAGRPQPGLPNRHDLIERAAAAMDAARAAGATIGYVRVAFTADEAAAVPHTNKTFSTLCQTGRPTRSDDEATAIAVRITPHDNDIVVRKTRVGAFSTTDLDQRLRDRGPDTLVLGGIATSGVVLSTIRDAADRDYRVVVSDLCADTDPDAHAVLVDRVFPRQAEVTTSDKLRALLSRNVAER